MKILGIESSCDDTSIAIIDSNKNIISNEVLSQTEIHREFNGIVPELAARNHIIQIDKVLKKCLRKSKLSLSDIDLFTATAGPGLVGGLIVGLTFAKTLALATKKPFVAVNHLEGHALLPRLTENVKYPYLTLLISGGHSNFYFIKNINDYIFLGGTRDDALGEAFDKVAKTLGLEYPGGPNLEALALSGNENLLNLPLPLINSKDLDLSFSGLKTAAVKLEKENKKKADIAACFQKTVSKILCSKITQAIEYCNKKFSCYKSVIISGGVAANSYLRNDIKKTIISKKKICAFPPVKLCTDNAVMIAWAGYERYNNGLKSTLKHRAKPRWPLEERKYLS